MLKSDEGNIKWERGWDEQVRHIVECGVLLGKDSEKGDRESIGSDI